MRREKGFTLIEIIVSITLMAILMAVAVPDLWKSYGHYKLEAAARRLASDIRAVQQRAVSEEQAEPAYRIVFNPFTDSYRVRLALNTLETIEMPPGIEIESVNLHNHSVTFTAKGSPIPAGTIVITNHWERREVRIVPVTGRVRIYAQ